MTMKTFCAPVVYLLLLSAASFAQNNIAMPQNRPTMGGNDPSQHIAREVLHDLLSDPYYTVFDDLSFQVNGRDVVLNGQVVDPGAKSDAESSVKKIEGVGKVTDNIEVLPPFPNDERIRREVYRSVYGYDNLGKYSWGAFPSIHIIVKGGRVTLVGMVDNDADQKVAGQRANMVPGVFSVANNLVVKGQENTNTAKK